MDVLERGFIVVAMTGFFVLMGLTGLMVLAG
jgi:hypothetical protein